MAAALPIIGLVASVASTALSGFSQFQQAQYQSAVAKNNAKIAEDNANRASYAAQVEQYRSDREFQAQQGTLFATQAASGLDVLGRSQLMTRENLARVRGEQAVDIRQQGLYDVRNFQQEQANFLGESRALKTQSWMILASTAFDIGGTIAKSPTGQKLAHSLIGGTK